MQYYPLDLPGLSILSKMSLQPLPVYPESLPVSKRFFELSLNGWVPVIVGVLYLIMTVTANMRHTRLTKEHKAGRGPPPKDYIKASRTLSNLVLAHNASLAIYSAWTFVYAVRYVVPYLFNGIREGGVSGLTNAFCTVPTHDPNTLSPFIVLFYYSKFWEILDSVILILKGKPVSALQSYHHCGAWTAMFVGTRFSASALWIFLTFNSLVHALMYSYYTFSTLKLPFAGALKKSMTTTQITQLIVGCFVASAYLWLRYSPKAYPSGIAASFGDVSGAHAESPLYMLLKETTGIDGSSFAFKLRNHLVREVSQNASSVAARSSSSIASKAIPHASQATHVAIFRESVLEAARNNAADGSVPCVSTTAQAFAVGFNVVYLLPLIYLFVRFYVRSYNKAQASKANKSQ